MYSINSMSRVVLLARNQKNMPPYVVITLKGITQKMWWLLGTNTRILEKENK